MNDSDTKSQKIEALNGLYREISMKSDVDLYMNIDGDKMILRRDSTKADGDIEVHIYSRVDYYGPVGFFEWVENDGLIFSTLEKEELGTIGDTDDWVESIVESLENNDVSEDILE